MFNVYIIVAVLLAGFVAAQGGNSSCEADMRKCLFKKIIDAQNDVSVASCMET